MLKTSCCFTWFFILPLVFWQSLSYPLKPAVNVLAGADSKHQNTDGMPCKGKLSLTEQKTFSKNNRQTQIYLTKLLLTLIIPFFLTPLGHLSAPTVLCRQTPQNYSLQFSTYISSFINFLIKYFCWRGKPVFQLFSTTFFFYLSFCCLKSPAVFAKQAFESIWVIFIASCNQAEPLYLELKKKIKRTANSENFVFHLHHHHQ